MVKDKRVDWCMRFKSGKRWLKRIRADHTGSFYTMRDYAIALKAFCDWVGKTPDGLVAEPTEVIEERLRDFQLYLQDERGLSRSTVVTKYHAPLKSFFKYNGKPLSLPTPQYVQKRRLPHTLEEIRKLMMVANVRERAIIAVLKDSGMSREDLVALKCGDLKELQTREDAVHIRAVRRKRQLSYDTFIGRNAIEHLKAYLDLRRRRGEQLTDDSPLFVTVSGKPLAPENISVMFSRLSKKVGFKTSPHRLRRFFESYVGLKAPSFLVKLWMGHSLGIERSYFIPPVEKQREAYLNAYSEIDLERSKIDAVELRKQQMRDMARMMGWSEEKLKAFEKFLVEFPAERIDSAVDEFLKSYQKKDCQKIVSSEELESYLNDGWKFVARLDDGRIIVTNE